MTNIWHELGIPATQDQREIRRAYARRLKTIDQRSEREAFQQLRIAYESALNHASRCGTEMRDTAPVSDAATAGSESPPNRAELDTARAPLADDPASPMATSPAEAIPVAHQQEQQQCDWTRAAELLQVLSTALADVGEARAASSFRAIMASDELENLNLRDALEWRLAFCFRDAEPFPLVFASAVAEHFNWRGRADLWRGPAGPALHKIFRRLDLLAKFEDLKARANRDAYQGHFSNNQEADRRAAEALLAAYSFWWFHWLALSPKLLNAMRALLAEIDWQTPELPRTFLYPKTVAWWRKAVAKPRVTFGMAGLAMIIGAVQSANFVSAVDLGRYQPAVFVALTMLLTAVAASVLLGIKRPAVRWRQHWQPRLMLKLAAAGERSFGRWFPNAFRAGLGWQHAGLALLLGPLLCLVAINRFKGPRPWLDPRHLPVFMVGAVLAVFAFFVTKYRLAYLLSRNSSLSQAARRHWKFAKYAALGLAGGALTLSGDGAPVVVYLTVVVYLLFAWYRRSRTA